jgi:hypothetical protein
MDELLRKSLGPHSRFPMSTGPGSSPQSQFSRYVPPSISPISSTACNKIPRILIVSSNTTLLKSNPSYGVHSPPLKSFRQPGRKSEMIPTITSTKPQSMMVLQSSTSTTLGLMRSRAMYWALVSNIFVSCNCWCTQMMTSPSSYYKLNYIKHVWGDEEEEMVDIAAGNIHAKNWQAEVQRILEDTVCHLFSQRHNAID